MTGRRALVGLSLLCALAFTAFTAASASAATTGTTAVTCLDTLAEASIPDNTGDYKDAHCDETGTLGASRYKHVAIGPETLVKGSNKKTKNETKENQSAILLATVGGVNVTITCTGVSSTGKLKNSLVGEDHRITGSEIIITYTGCTMTPAPCTVNSPGQAVGTGVTNALKSESVEGTPTMTQKFEPEKEVGGKKIFIELEIKGVGCAIAGTYKVEGTVSAQPSGQMEAGGTPERGRSTGATLNVNLEKNASSTLIVAGQKAGLTQSETIVMDDAEEKPIASTGPPFFF